MYLFIYLLILVLDLNIPDIHSNIIMYLHLFLVTKIFLVAEFST